jgi:hypothetical protein
MIVFVSYIRRDHDVASLQKIQTLLTSLGRSYIDDLHDHGESDRRETVERALNTADVFVAVFSPNYRTTPWTKWEFELATLRGIPIFILLPDGVLVKPPSPYSPSTRTEPDRLGSADSRELLVTAPPSNMEENRHVS